jgi:restriction endonuclease Mrr
MTAHPTLQAAAHREPTLAERFDPRPADEDRYLRAIARRNTAWANYREARELLEAATARGYSDLTAWIRNVNETQHEWEWAERDLIYEKARWNTEGVPW